MKYTLRVHEIEAEPVSIAGQRLHVAVIDERAHVIPSDVFDLLLQPLVVPAVVPAAVIEAAAQAVPVKRTPAPKSKPKPTVKANGNGAPRTPTTLDRITSTLRTCGGLTASELATHVFPEMNQLQRSQNLSYWTSEGKKRGIIEKREYPDSGLDKWFLVQQ